MIINHNLGAMSALSALNTNSNALNSALEKLSSGKKINSAADDASGYAISEKMQGQINGLGQASQNSQDGISLIQTASGAMNEVTNILQTMRTLAVEASNGTATTDDQTDLQDEFGQLASQIDYIANNTQFNTQALTSGASAGLTFTFQIGSNEGQTFAINIAGLDTGTLGLSTASISTQSDAYSAISSVEAAIETVSADQANLGAYQNRLESNINNLSSTSDNLTSAESGITDVDMASEMAQYTQDSVLQQAAVSMLAQANQTPQLVLKLLS